MLTWHLFKKQKKPSLLYCSRFSFPVFKRLEYGNFRSVAIAIPANISSAFEKNFCTPVWSPQMFHSNNCSALFSWKTSSIAQSDLNSANTAAKISIWFLCHRYTLLTNANDSIERHQQWYKSVFPACRKYLEVLTSNHT